MFKEELEKINMKINTLKVKTKTMVIAPVNIEYSRWPTSRTGGKFQIPGISDRRK